MIVHQHAEQLCCAHWRGQQPFRARSPWSVLVAGYRRRIIARISAEAGFNVPYTRDNRRELIATPLVTEPGLDSRRSLRFASCTAASVAACAFASGRMLHSSSCMQWMSSMCHRTRNCIACVQPAREVLLPIISNHQRLPRCAPLALSMHHLLQVQQMAPEEQPLSVPDRWPELLARARDRCGAAF